MYNDIGPGTLSIKIFKDGQEIESLREAWTRFGCRLDADIDFFQVVIKTISEAICPYVIAVFEGDTPRAILAGRIEDAPFTVKFGYKTLYQTKIRTLILLNGGYMGDTSQAVSEIFVDRLRSLLEEGEFGLIFFHMLPDVSPMHDAVKDRNSCFFRDQLAVTNIHRTCRFADGPGTFVGTLDKSRQSEFRKYSSRLKKQFGDRMQVRVFRTGDDITGIMKDIESVASNTYQRALGVGFIDDHQRRRRYEFTLEKGWMHAYIMYLDQRPVAFWTYFRYGDTIITDTTGFDTELSYYKPGLLLLLRLMEDAWESRSIKYVDFGPGEAQYKRVLSNRCEHETSFYIYPHSLRGIWLNFLRNTVLAGDQAAKKMLSRFGLLNKTKYIFRKRMRERLARKD